MRKAKIRHNNISSPDIAIGKLLPIPIIATSKMMQAINRLFWSCHSEKSSFRVIC